MLLKCEILLKTNTTLSYGDLSSSGTQGPLTALGHYGQGRKTEKVAARGNVSRGEKTPKAGFTYFPSLQRAVLGNSVACLVLIKHRRVWADSKPDNIVRVQEKPVLTMGCNFINRITMHLTVIPDSNVLP